MPSGRHRTDASLWRSTHRTVPPAETLDCFGRHASTLGITRLANVTGLDYLGIPVFMAIRPNARALSVAQGKGLDVASARTSAFMEAAERAHAETIRRSVRVASYRALARKARVVDPASLTRLCGRRFSADQDIGWIAGRSLRDGKTVWVPHEIVHADFTGPKYPESGCFPSDSNGLAAGNTAAEALVAAISEVIERDGTGLWQRTPLRGRVERRLRLDTVSDRPCRALIDRLAACAIDLAVWDATTDIGVPVFLCRIRESPDNTRSRFGAFWGAGCHPARAIAFVRAVTEAAQTRLTYIVGSRDDLKRRDYAPSPRQALFDVIMDEQAAMLPGRDYAAAPDIGTASADDDVERLLARLAVAGLPAVVVVELTQAMIGMPVVRAIVPGLEPSHEHRSSLPGERARRLTAGSGR